MVSTKPSSQEVEIYIHMSPEAGIHTELGDIGVRIVNSLPNTIQIIRSLKRILSTHAFHWMRGAQPGLEVGHWQLNENHVYSLMYVCLAVLYE